ncbi:ATP-grasp domain protein [Streptomyces ipomoeae]|uniref:ATP-grasp domain protein n=2 Tax=Streptomyces ipomoeae TaxID=103232 RepID=L1KYL3_9ACTN|nr:ATP-grasp domain-containing protein [Streptomyces ipomoeae]EKX65644.1 ATP-grasp domain protein [Streptomyces ipomoeae 91-03]MDX2694210.1 ATP-grasp domain-containing protein [Streptomyces ipomoeae]MDX2821644.1 ATP-grasp domain-containing protein [Streptomyces ipomoeae]MDX2840157.1 ATP-grasp domain-containing protein [Streptomyces ipomoeae]MDX2874001.1 ATP-grasp domain-containing protein [Streptomyces ipomoeae]
MVSRVRVWLNRTYAENVFFMDQLRSNPQARPVDIHATHGDADSPVLAAADTADLEPEGLSPAAYVEYALDQCVKRGIDVFVPRLHQAAIAAHREEFAAVGTVLLAPPAEAIEVFEDKVTAYEAVQAHGVPVPPWFRVTGADELIAAVEKLEGAGHKACFKPAAGAGGVGFRVVTRAPFSLVHLNGFPSPYVSLDMVVGALRAADEPVDWLVMPRLEQPEVSVDCLTGPDGRVRMAVGRTKNGRRRGFTLHPAWIEPALRIAESFGLHYLTNIQFRMYGDVPVLMDVNTRPAGGLHQLALCGINAPWAAVQLALGEETGDLTPARLGPDYTVVSGPRVVRPVMLPHQEMDVPGVVGVPGGVGVPVVLDVPLSAVEPVEARSLAVTPPDAPTRASAPAVCKPAADRPLAV